MKLFPLLVVMLAFGALAVPAASATGACTPYLAFIDPNPVSHQCAGVTASGDQLCAYASSVVKCVKLL